MWSKTVRSWVLTRRESHRDGRRVTKRKGPPTMARDEFARSLGSKGPRKETRCIARYLARRSVRLNREGHGFVLQSRARMMQAHECHPNDFPDIVSQSPMPATGVRSAPRG